MPEPLIVVAGGKMDPELSNPTQTPKHDSRPECLLAPARGLHATLVARSWDSAIALLLSISASMQPGYFTYLLYIFATSSYLSSTYSYCFSSFLVGVVALSVDRAGHSKSV
ncbi:hypothetical protein BGZ61DRAFT_461614 [Ilyonectria robusta]|uniref:uncharacterized protein n=1 Tax=Ilyonectria robusta TaxID=1079257 RepID=UPI001E8CA22A|nr:uncharacterized protein BGZ61DRAFT_461614 [Ilyonectria robusta]KAH8666095.1 hypothetical protein BGZ61DRAFT_461614 [Ilyonectria robusta]